MGRTRPIWTRPYPNAQLNRSSTDYATALPYYPRYLTQEWERCCIAAGVPVISLHDARHTSATTGADAGVPQHVMKDRLGHASRRTTDEVYTHVLD